MEMELRTTQRMRRNEQLTRTAAKQADTAGSPARTPSAQPRTPADKLSVSRQALAWLDRQAELDREREMRRQERQSDSLSALESKKQALDDLSKKLKVLSKCQKIAASIMKGDRVPPEDLLYLMKHDQVGYKLAMAMRRRNPDPEDEKSVLDDEDKNGSSVEGAESGGGEAPGVSATEASSGGGEAPPTSE